MRVQIYILCAYKYIFYARTNIYSMRVQIYILCAYKYIFYARTNIYSMRVKIYIFRVILLYRRCKSYCQKVLPAHAIIAVRARYNS